MDKQIIAVIGHETVAHFMKWCLDNGLKDAGRSNKLAVDDCGNEYVGIFQHEDLIGRRFDHVIDFDDLRAELYRRVKNG